MWLDDATALCFGNLIGCWTAGVKARCVGFRSLDVGFSYYSDAVVLVSLVSSKRICALPPTSVHCDVSSVVDAREGGYGNGW